MKRVGDQAPRYSLTATGRRVGALITVAGLMILGVVYVALIRDSRDQPASAPPTQVETPSTTSPERPAPAPVAPPAVSESLNRAAPPTVREVQPRVAPARPSASPAPPNASTAGITRPPSRSQPVAVAPPIAVADEPVAVLPAKPDDVAAVGRPSPNPPGDVAASTPSVPPSERAFADESVTLATILKSYERAYDQLDASAAAALWPTVDVRALTRAFARLERQDLEFRRCTFAVSVNEATAHCAGLLQYARSIGDTAPRVEDHIWTIEFTRASGADWKISRITAR